MEKVKLQNIYERNCPKRPVLKNTILAFVGGGIMGAGAQVLSIFYQNSFSISAEEAIAPTGWDYLTDLLKFSGRVYLFRLLVFQIVLHPAH